MDELSQPILLCSQDSSAFTAEPLRYYLLLGFIPPARNPKNGYQEYG